MKPAIMHIDMDAFFAAVEQRDHPELQGKPVIVGGSKESRGVVSTASYEARKFGVHSAMPMAEAVRRCPQGIYLPVDMQKYRAVSQQIMQIFQQFTPEVEALSLDEAFLDLTGSQKLFGPARQIGQTIKEQIKQQLHLTASVGLSYNKFLLYFAGRFGAKGMAAVYSTYDGCGQQNGADAGADGCGYYWQAGPYGCRFAGTFAG